MWYQPKEGTETLAHVVNVSRNDKNELEFYDSQSGKTYGKEYIDKMNKIVSTKFQVSKSIIQKNYYNIILGEW